MLVCLDVTMPKNLSNYGPLIVLLVSPESFGQGGLHICCFTNFGPIAQNLLNPK